MRYALPVVGLLVVAVLMSGCLFGSSSPGVELPYPPFRDASVIKLDPDGTVAWQTRLSFGHDTIPSTITPMPNGGYALTGQAISEGNFSFPHPFVAMLDANGSLLWNRTLPSFMGLSASGAAPAPDGDLIVAGGSGKYIRLDANGTVLWEKVLFRWTAIRTNVPAPSGGYLIGGSADGDAAIALLDESGSVLWSTTLGGPKSESIERILPLADGGVAVAGTADDGWRIRSSVRVARLDGDGVALWDRTVEVSDRMLIWEVSDLRERGGNLEVIYEIIRLEGDGACETVVATLGQDGIPVERRTLDAFTPVLQSPDGGYTFAAFPVGEGGWYYYGTILHLVRLDESGAVIRDSAVDLGEGSQTGSLVRTDDGGYIVAVTHGPAYGVSFPTASGGAAAVSIAFRRE